MYTINVNQINLIMYKKALIINLQRVCFVGLLGLVSFPLAAEDDYTKSISTMEAHTFDNAGVTEVTQQKKGIAINGTVRDTQREPLPGVNIVIKGTTSGTVTDVDGNYFITVPDKKSVLVFQYIGFESQEITVGNQLNVNVALKEDAKTLDEVVVVGFGKQKKVSVVGAVTTIEPRKLQVGTSRSMSTNLIGQLAGVIGAQRTGEPGYDNSTFFIRGISSFKGSNNPLVLVDGIERDLNNIDPAEIESFSILKDASASAVYGVRGANGVILINTKRGKIGKPSVNVRFEQAVTMLGKTPKLIGSYDYLSLMNELYADEGLPAPYKDIEKYRTGEDPDLYPDVDWIDAIMKDMGHNTRANLEVSGGSEILRYSLVASVYSEKGLLENDSRQEWDSSTRLRRYNLRSNVDVNVTPTTLLRVSIGGYLQEGTSAPDRAPKLYEDAFFTPPYVHPTRYSTGEIPKHGQHNNPWAVTTQNGYKNTSTTKIESLFSVEQDLKFLLPGLKVKGVFSFDSYSANSVLRTKEPNYYDAAATRRNPDGTLNLTIQSYGKPYLDYMKEAEFGTKSVYLEGSINYDQTFGKHAISAMFMYNQRSLDEGEKLPFRFQGIAGRASYTYDSRYVGEVNFGYNGSENFASGHRFGFFPSVALGWVISEEPFMERYKNTLSTLKLRGSYGLVGNDCLGQNRRDIRFPYLTTIDVTDGYYWGVDNNYGYANGKQEGLAGSPLLTWEKVKKLNVGIDLGLWNALDLSVDYFYDLRYDIFLQRQTIPSTAGFIQVPFANYGEASNQGVDLSLAFNKQLGKDWTIMLQGTFTYAQSKIREMDEPLSVVGTNRARTGHRINQLFGLVDDGLFTEDDFKADGSLKEGLPRHTFGPVRPGDIKYKDLNDDGVVDSFDETAIGGTIDPQLVYGFGATVKYRQFDLGFFFQGNGETYRVIGAGKNAFIPGSGDGWGAIYSNYNDRWTPENPSQNVFWPRLSRMENKNNAQSSTWWLRNMSMLRLKNIEVGYSFSKKTLLPNFIQSARIFIAGSNLLQFSKFKMWDPELDTPNGQCYPITKSVSLGLNVSF